MILLQNQDIMSFCNLANIFFVLVMSDSPQWVDLEQRLYYLIESYHPDDQVSPDSVIKIFKSF